MRIWVLVLLTISLLHGHLIVSTIHGKSIANFSIFGISTCFQDQTLHVRQDPFLGSTEEFQELRDSVLAMPLLRNSWGNPLNSVYFESTRGFVLKFNLQGAENELLKV